MQKKRSALKRGFSYGEKVGPGPPVKGGPWAPIYGGDENQMVPKLIEALDRGVAQ